MIERANVWRAPGMLDLAVLSVFGFSGYAALLATAPLWAVSGGATAAGAGLVNGVLLAATVLAQLAVPRALATWGTGPVLVAGLLLLGVPAPAYLLSDGLGWVLGLSAVRGLGFGILTVVGSAVVAHLVPAGRRGAAIGVYGLAVAVPNLVLLPGSVPVVDRWGFGPVFWAGALPLLGVPSALRLARVLRDVGHVRPTRADEESRVSVRTLRGIVPPTMVLFSVTMAGGALLTFAPQLGRSSVGSMARIATDLRLKAYRTAFGLYGRCCPGSAARAATSLWFTVPRRPFHPGNDPALPPGLQFGVNVDGGVVRGTRWGSGPLVYLVHGWAGSSAQFAGVVETLVAAGFCVVAFDAPNHGKSGPGPSGRRRTHAVEFARALAGVVHRHGPAYAVVAHSLGAVATGLAVRSGWVLVPRLVLLAPLTEVSGPLDHLAQQLGLPDRVRRRLDSQVQARTGHPVDDFRLDRMLEEMAAAPMLVIGDRGDNAILDDPDVGRVVARFLEGARLRAVS